MNRAQLLLSVLADGRKHSRAEVFERVGFMLTNNAASELRAQGYDVQHTVEKNVHVYSLLSGRGTSVNAGGRAQGNPPAQNPIPRPESSLPRLGGESVSREARPEVERPVATDVPRLTSPPCTDRGGADTMTTFPAPVPFGPRVLKGPTAEPSSRANGWASPVGNDGDAGADTRLGGESVSREARGPVERLTAFPAPGFQALHPAQIGAGGELANGERGPSPAPMFPPPCPAAALPWAAAGQLSLLESATA